MSKQAYSYLRVSTIGQMDGDGIDRQRAAVKAYAKRNRISIAAEYRDEGVSGTKELENRPGLAGLLADAGRGDVKLVLIERADRLARDLMVSEIILADLRSAGVSVVAVDSGVDLTAADDPTKRLIRQILGAVAEFDKSVLVAKLRVARDRIRAQTGRCEGIKPYGTLPGEQAVIARIIELRKNAGMLEPMSYRKIARQLLAEGLTSRGGRPWQASTLQGIFIANTRRKRRLPQK